MRGIDDTGMHPTRWREISLGDKALLGIYPPHHSLSMTISSGKYPSEV